jgi:hypothetical protein
MYKTIGSCLEHSVSNSHNDILDGSPNDLPVCYRTFVIISSVTELLSLVNVCFTE